jgi:hypothetical protein
MRGLKLGVHYQLSELQKEVLRLLTEEYLTPSKIAIYRHTSLNAVYKVIKVLKEKGLINMKTQKVEKIQCTENSTFKKTTQIRLHGQEFNIQIITKGKNYEDIRNKSNVRIIDDNTIRLYENSIEVYSEQSFFSDDVKQATAKSFQYFNRLFTRLENDLDVLIVKSRHDNIKLVKNHYSLINNGLAKELNEQNVKIRLYASEDNKMWFEIDNSWNLNEAETTHKETAERDMQKVVQRTFNDLRDNYANREVPVMSEILIVINELTKQNIETATGLNIIVKMLKERETPQETEGLKDFKLDYVG